MRYGKLDKKFKRSWVRALRTPPDEGGYHQGRGRLVSADDRFCCLGVAADLMIRQGLTTAQWSKLNNGSWCFGGGWAATLSDHEALKINLDRDAMERLITMNDHQRYNFSQIADWIETNL